MTEVSVKDQVLALVPEEGDLQQRALQLTETLLRDGAQVRHLLEKSLEGSKKDDKKRRQELLCKRQQLYKDLSPSNGLFLELKGISQLLRREGGALRDDETLQQTKALLSSIDETLCALKELIGPDKTFPWRLSYVTDVDPESDGGMITLGGGAILDSNGRNVWADYCGTCDLELDDNEARWRCFSCGGVQCEDCRRAWDAHSLCTDPGVILEQSHPTFLRLDIASSNGSLSSTLVNLFQTWSPRPCFRKCGVNEEWLTYADVFDRVRRIATRVKGSCASQILLCFPAGSMDFYLADLACALVGVTSIGIPVLPPLEPLPSAQAVICEDVLRGTMTFPPKTTFLDISEESCSELKMFNVPMDQQDSNSLYTIYYSSGSTGKPKAFPLTRKAFIEDFSVAEDCFPECWFSFQPPYWATDRLVVYQALYNGYRVGFSRRQPTLPEVIEDACQLEPTVLTVPPMVLQFLSTLHPTPSLGSRLRYIACGGAPVGSSIKQWVTETYGVPCIEGYGTTECGGIASDGRVLPRVADSLRIKDPKTGVWLDPRQEGNVTGELWVENFNTKDLVELSEGGTRIKVVGRTGAAASFKMENGKWCSLVDIEQEIMRMCSPDLVTEAMVLRNSQNVLVLVARLPDGSVNEKQLLREIRERVTVPTGAFPQAILVTEDPFPLTRTLKVRRELVMEEFRGPVEQIQTVDVFEATGLDAAELAARILGHPVNPEQSFFENGGDSISAVLFLKEIRFHMNGDAPDWRALLNEPLEGGVQDEQDAVAGVDYALSKPVDSQACHVLLTGATGFLGKHVLQALLEQDDDTIIVCLVRPQSKGKLDSSERIQIVTEVPTDLAYRRVVHLAAEVNHVRSYDSLKETNVRMTEQLLKLRLAPMLYCSTSSTLDGEPPFLDGYTQTKWVSEKMVLRSGGTCVWPPLLLWGNPRDWLTRLIKYCVKSQTFPNQLGFLPCAPVEVCARELVSGKACSSWDLDLQVLFLLIQMERPMRGMPLAVLRANASRDPQCDLYPALPLLQGTCVGTARSPELQVLPLSADLVENLLRSLDL